MSNRITRSLSLTNNPGLKRVVWIVVSIAGVMTAFGTIKANVNSVETTHHAESTYVTKTDFKSFIQDEQLAKLRDSAETSAQFTILLQTTFGLKAQIAGLDSQIRCMRGQRSRC